MNWLVNMEGGILLFIQENLRMPVLNEIMCFITRLGDKGYIWIAFAIVMLLFKRTRRAGAVCAAALLLSLLVTNITLKNIIQRIRPYEVINSLKILVDAEHSFSFPSGHSSSSLAAGWAMFRTLPKKWGVPALALGIVIALSRMYVGVHYPTDVLGGVIIGVTVAELAILICRKVGARFARKA